MIIQIWLGEFETGAQLAGPEETAALLGR